VITVNPPIFTGLLGWLYARLDGAAFALDSHPAGFGAKRNALGRWTLPLHAWLAARSMAVLVTTEDWAKVVRGWGGHPVIVHEPPAWELSPAPPLEPRLRALFVCTFAQDEPVEQVIGAARRCPSVDIEITGDLARAPQALLGAVPPNVHFVGYLGPDAYREAISRANVVLALSMEPTSVMRCAYEAIYAGRPVIVWDWPAAREVFPTAVTCGPDAESLAAALRSVVAGYDELARQAPAARRTQVDRWQHQREELRERLGMDTQQHHPDAPVARRPEDPSAIQANLPRGAQDGSEWPRTRFPG
jgi:glycosyltransferase involved in cell wall biosynthesis